MIKRKMSVLLLAALFVLQMTGSVFAAGNVPIDTEGRSVARAVSAYGLEADGKLYAFLEEDGRYDFSKTTVSLQSNALNSDTESPLRKVSDNATTNVHYMFLIDNSGSMATYRKVVGSYINAIEENETQEAYYTVATFNDRFKVVKERMTDVEEVKKTISNLSYKGYTDPYTGVQEAIDYLDTYARTSGDVISLIVITDGEPCLRKPAREKELAAAAAEDIQNSPEVILSTLCTNKWSGEAKKALTTGSGLHSVVSGSSRASEEGKKMAEFLDGLYRTVFVLKQNENLPDKFDITLKLTNVLNWNGAKETILDKEQPVINNVSMLSAEVGDSKTFADKVQTDDPEDPDQTENTEDTEPSDTSETEATEDSGTTETSGTDETSGTEDSVPASSGSEEGSAGGETTETEATDDTTAIAPAETEGSGQNSILNGLPVWLIPAAIAAGAFLLIAAVVVIIIVVSKSKKKAAKSAMASEPDTFVMPASAAEPISKTVAVPYASKAEPDKISRTEDPMTAVSSQGIPVALDVFSGTCLSNDRKFALKDSLMIGSDPSCDIVFDAKDMAPQAARIIFTGGQVYVESGAVSEVTVGGMRIQGQNVLRSGDVISVGEAEFMLKF